MLIIIIIIQYNYLLWLLFNYLAIWSIRNVFVHSFPKITFSWNFLTFTSLCSYLFLMQLFMHMLYMYYVFVFDIMEMMQFRITAYLQNIIWLSLCVCYFNCDGREGGGGETLLVIVKREIWFDSLIYIDILYFKIKYIYKCSFS